jgi:hypothetical protein
LTGEIKPAFLGQPVSHQERHLSDDEQEGQAGPAERFEGHPPIGRLGAPDGPVEQAMATRSGT